MQYTEKIVSNEYLKHDVLCYWQMDGYIPQKEGIDSRYIPKGQSLLIFNYGDVINLPDKQIHSPFFVVPTITSSLMINQTGNINLFGISFLGDGLFKIINEPLKHVNQPLPESLNMACEILYNKMHNLKFEEKLLHAEDFVLNKLNRNIHSKTLSDAIALIHKENGIINIDDLSKKLNISSRQLQRLFKTRLSISPKDYCKIIRVNNYLEYIVNKNNDIDWMDLVVEFDYHDQPHLIKEVKSLANLSPQKLIKYRDTLYHRYTTD